MWLRRLVPCLMLWSLVPWVQAATWSHVATPLSADDLRRIIAGDPCQIKVNLPDNCIACVYDSVDDISKRCDVPRTPSACAAYTGQGRPSCTTASQSCSGFLHVYSGAGCHPQNEFGEVSLCARNYSVATQTNQAGGSCP